MEKVYLNEERYSDPKEGFKAIGRVIEGRDHKPGATLLDIGCATGELVHYLKEILPKFGLMTGIDVSADMIMQAKAKVKGADFLSGSILDNEFFEENKYDVVCCSGVLSIFDDVTIPIANSIKCLKPYGQSIFFGPFNSDPIDVVMQYRYANETEKVWLKGLNIFSQVTVENILKDLGGIKWKWHNFAMPFAIEKTPDDPVRLWTIPTQTDPYQQIGGTCQFFDFKLLEVNKTS